MNLLLLFATATLVCASSDVGFGTLQIADASNSGPQLNVFISKTQVVANHRASVFKYHPEGHFLSFVSRKHLAVNRAKKLVMTIEPHQGFNLSEERDPSGKRYITYVGDKSFELCRDGSLAYSSDCPAARSVCITYEDVVDL